MTRLLLRVVWVIFYVVGWLHKNLCHSCNILTNKPYHFAKMIILGSESKILLNKNTLD